MDKTQLLIFRWGTEEYGVPVEDIIGIAANTGVNRLAITKGIEEISNRQDKPIPITFVDAGLKTEDSNLALIMHSNGVQIAILVDEVIKVTVVSNGNEQVSGTTIATFRICQMKH